MKNYLTKAKNNLKTQFTKERMLTCVMAAAMLSVLFAVPVFAAPDISVAVDKVFGLVFKSFSAVGIITVVVGVAQFISSFRNDDAEGKSRAANVFVAGLLMVAFGISGLTIFADLIKEAFNFTV